MRSPPISQNLLTLLKKEYKLFEFRAIRTMGIVFIQSGPLILSCRLYSTYYHTSAQSIALGRSVKEALFLEDERDADVE